MDELKGTKKKHTGTCAWTVPLVLRKKKTKQITEILHKNTTFYK